MPRRRSSRSGSSIASGRPLLLVSLAVMLVSPTLLGLAFVLGSGVSGGTVSLPCLLVYIVAFAVGLVFLPLVAAVGQGPTFWIFAAVCAFGLISVYRSVPETKGRSFVEIDAEVRAHLRPSA